MSILVLVVHPSSLIDEAVIDKGPGRRGAADECEHIAARAGCRRLHELPIAESVEASHSGAIPLNINIGRCLNLRARERCVHETLDGIRDAGLGHEWGSGRECTQQSIVAERGTEQTDAVPNIRVGREEEDRRVLVTAAGRGASPGRIRRGEAEVVARSVALKATIGENRDTLVAAGVGDDEVALAGVNSRGLIRNKIVLPADETTEAEHKA